MSRPPRPEELPEDYQFTGPRGLFITGPLKAANQARAAELAIMEVAGANAAWWPSLDESLFFLTGVPDPHPDALLRLYDEDSKRALKAPTQYRPEIMVVNPFKHLDVQTSFYLGHIVGHAQVERIYYLGPASSLGPMREPLTSRPDFAVISDPTEVFRWEAPGGFVVSALAEVSQQ